MYQQIESPSYTQSIACFHFSALEQSKAANCWDSASGKWPCRDAYSLIFQDYDPYLCSSCVDWAHLITSAVTRFLVTAQADPDLSPALESGK